MMPALPFVKTLLGWNGDVPNMADRDSQASRAIAGRLLDHLQISTKVAHTGQTAAASEVEVGLGGGVGEAVVAAVAGAGAARWRARR